VLPALSTANVRELLRAVLPLPHLSPQDATALVIEHLVNRSRSRSSRLKHRQQLKAPPSSDIGKTVPSSSPLDIC
jgi:hypothetical protein